MSAIASDRYIAKCKLRIPIHSRTYANVTYPNTDPNPNSDHKSNPFPNPNLHPKTDPNPNLVPNPNLGTCEDSRFD